MKFLAFVLCLLPTLVGVWYQERALNRTCDLNLVNLPSCSCIVGAISSDLEIHVCLLRLRRWLLASSRARS